MKPAAHRTYIATMTLVVILALAYLGYTGYSYYTTGIEERFYHPDYESLKPSGGIGHGLGIIGSVFMLIGVSSYMMRKRMRSMARMGKLKHWLEFHIFLCVLGPILVLFHTSFKFGGLVSVSFWSMVAVFLSGIAGRFIYIQIPRSIEGRELSLNEIRELKTDVGRVLSSRFSIDPVLLETILESTRIMGTPNPRKFNPVKTVKKALKQSGIKRGERSGIIKLVRHEVSINRKIERLQTMQNLFKYWHVAHLPFALLMLIIMIIHVIVTVLFGYRWIF